LEVLVTKVVTLQLKDTLAEMDLYKTEMAVGVALVVLEQAPLQTLVQVKADLETDLIHLGQVLHHQV
jgi:hypothetical protein